MQETRPLTEGEAEELQGFLVANLSKLFNSSKSTEDGIIRNVANQAAIWYGKQNLRPPRIRVLVNPDNEVWIDVGFMLKLN